MKILLKKNGTTLVELVVVMAVVAIIGVIVTTACVGISFNVNFNAAQQEILSDLNLAKTLVESKILPCDEKGYVFTVNGEGALSVSGGGESFSLSFRDGSLIYETGGESSSLYTFTRLDGIAFSGSGENDLVKTTISFLSPKGENDSIVYMHALRAADFVEVT